MPQLLIKPRGWVENKGTSAIPIVVHEPPDVTAQIFWLKNRKPSEWRDAWNIDVSAGKYLISDHPMTMEEWARERALVELTEDDVKEIEPPKNGNGAKHRGR